ncbi:MAG: acyl-CoA thioesterase [Hyphomonadaceae bacterium]
MTHFLPIDRKAERTFTLRVTEELCVGPHGHVFLFGGAGLGAAVLALEQTFERGLVWATAQYISFARIGAEVALDVAVAQQGKSVTQATVTGRVGDQTIFSVMAALGERDGYPDQHWRDMPDMAPPDQCEQEPQRPTQDPSARLRQSLDVRGMPGAERREMAMQTGRTLLWIRQKQVAPVDAATLAIFADFVPGAIGGALGRGGGGNSLDNNLRVRKIVPTEWVLCDVQAQAAARGFGHGHMRLYASDGTLMATASQSIVLRSYHEPAATAGKA